MKMVNLEPSVIPLIEFLYYVLFVYPFLAKRCNFIATFAYCRNMLSVCDASVL